MTPEDVLAELAQMFPKSSVNITYSAWIHRRPFGMGDNHEQEWSIFVVGHDGEADIQVLGSTPELALANLKATYNV